MEQCDCSSLTLIKKPTQMNDIKMLDFENMNIKELLVECNKMSKRLKSLKIDKKIWSAISVFFICLNLISSAIFFNLIFFILNSIFVIFWARVLIFCLRRLKELTLVQDELHRIMIKLKADYNR